MADESTADDEAIYDIWRRLTPVEVEDIFEALENLAHAFAQLRGKRPTAEMRTVAEELRDGPLGLGFLPVVKAVLA